MCGIAGYLRHRDAPHDEQTIHRMVEAITHRGPDANGFLQQEGVSFGHRRLSIIDLEAGKQPMQTRDGRYWIVFNGEIYNYAELKTTLEPRYSFDTNSDTEVLLNLYVEHGERCVDFLRGMFAFAIYDHREQSLFIARDHFGQKPLYYCQDDRGFAFASEIKSLLAYDNALRELNHEALYEYLTVRIITPPRTMYKNIQKLAPGHYLTLRQGKLESRRYWALDYRNKIDGSLPEVTDLLDQQLEDTVRYHLVSDVPVGAFLSGGVDSGLIVAEMSGITGGGFDTFTGDVNYREYSELEFARRLSDQYKTRNHVLSFQPSLVESLPDVLWHLDEPSDSLCVAMYYLCGLASEHVKVILGGDGGDELFGGYDRYYGYTYASWFALLPGFLRSGIVRPLLNRISDGNWYQSVGHQLKWLETIARYEGSERYAKSLSYFYFSDEFKQALYTPKFLQEVGAFDPEQTIKHYFDTAQANDALDRMLNSDSCIRMPDHPVMVLDRMSMAHGLEARAPFLDHKLAEFCATIPGHMKVSGRKRRIIQMELAKKYLPPEHLSRKKQGFASPITYMLAKEFEKIYNTFLRHSRLVEENILNAEFVHQLVNEHLSGKYDHGQRLWLISSAELWYRMNIDGQGREGIGEQLRRAA